jgi:hypothetical protein
MGRNNTEIGKRSGCRSKPGLEKGGMEEIAGCQNKGERTLPESRNIEIERDGGDITAGWRRYRPVHYEDETAAG